MVATVVPLLSKTQLSEFQRRKQEERDQSQKSNEDSQSLLAQLLSNLEERRKAFDGLTGPFQAEASQGLAFLSRFFDFSHEFFATLKGNMTQFSEKNDREKKMFDSLFKRAAAFKEDMECHQKALTIQPLEAAGSHVNYFSALTLSVMMLIISIDFYELSIEISNVYFYLGSYYDALTEFLQVFINLTNWFLVMYNRILSTANKYNNEGVVPTVWQWVMKWSSRHNSNNFRELQNYLAVINEDYFGVADQSGDVTSAPYLYNRTQYDPSLTYDWHPNDSNNQADVNTSNIRVSIGDSSTVAQYVLDFSRAGNSSTYSVFYTQSLTYTNGAGTIPTIYYIQPSGFDDLILGTSIAMAGLTTDDYGSELGSFYSAYRDSLSSNVQLDTFSNGITSTLETLTSKETEISNNLSVLQQAVNNTFSQFTEILDAIWKGAEPPWPPCFDSLSCRGRRLVNAFYGI